MVDVDLPWESGDIGGSNDLDVKDSPDLVDQPNDQDVVSNNPSEGGVLTPSQRRQGSGQRLGMISQQPKQQWNSGASSRSQNHSIQNDYGDELSSEQDPGEEHYRTQNRSPDGKPSGGKARKLREIVVENDQRNRGESRESATMLFGSAADGNDSSRGQSKGAHPSRGKEKDRVSLARE